MAHRVIWSPAALDDVEGIAAFIARDSPGYAAAVIRKLILSARRLERFPHSGKPVPELDDSAVRQVTVPPYRIIYRLEAGSITIATVLHSAQDFEAAIKRV